MPMTLTRARLIFFSRRRIPIRLRFGELRHIAARNLLRLKADIDDLQTLLIEEGFERCELPNRGHVDNYATEEELVNHLKALIRLATDIDLTVEVDSL